MKFLLPLLLIFILCGFAQAQDRIKVSASYLNTEFQANPVENLEYLKGFSIDADGRIIGGNGWRLGGIFNYQKVYDQKVFKNYFNGHSMVDVFRNVNTYSFGAQLSKTIGPVEPFAAFLIGVKRIHEDQKFHYDVVRKYRFGADLVFHKESYFFIRPFFVEFERGHILADYMCTNNTFVFLDGTTQKYGAGIGFRF